MILSAQVKLYIQQGLKFPIIWSFGLRGLMNNTYMHIPRPIFVKHLVQATTGRQCMTPKESLAL